MTKPHKRQCMHCKRPFVFNDRIRYFYQKPKDSIPCDICEETNYLTDQKAKSVLLVVSIISGVIAALPLLGSLWFLFAPLFLTGHFLGFIFLVIPFIGFVVTSALMRVIYRNYLWQTHSLSAKFISPFLDNLK